MAKISTIISYVDVDGDYGPVDGVEVTCKRCGHSEESGGTDNPSLKSTLFYCVKTVQEARVIFTILIHDRGKCIRLMTLVP